MADRKSASSACLAMVMWLSLVLTLNATSASRNEVQTFRTGDGMTLVRLATGAKLIDHQGKDIQLPLVLQNVVVKNDRRVYMFYYKMYLFFDNGRLVFYVRENRAKKTYTIEKINGRFYPGDYTQVHCSTADLNLTYPKRLRYSCTSAQTLACYAKSNQTDDLADRKVVAQISFDTLEFEMMNSDPSKEDFIRPPFPSSCFHQHAEPSRAPQLAGGKLVPSEDGTTIVSASVSALLHDPNRRPDSTLALRLTSVDVFPDYSLDDGNHWLLVLNFDKGRLVIYAHRAGRKFVLTQIEALFLPKRHKQMSCITKSILIDFPSSKRYSCKKKQTIHCHKIYGGDSVAEITFDELEFDLNDADPDKSARGEFTHEPYEDSCRIA